MPIGSTETTKTWESERAFFDSLAKAAPPFVLERVSRRYEVAMSRPLYPLEVAYQLLGDLAGKRILDIGCGLGENSLLFAKWGATVVGVDISKESIEVARRRAESYGLDKAATFYETPFERVPDTHEPFDIVWSAAFLHHVLDRLPEVCAIIERLVRRDGFVLFSEPVRLSRAIKVMRALIPAGRQGTIDERPLERHDLDVIQSRFIFESSRLFGPVSRLTRFVVPTDYETAPVLRRVLADGLCRFDQRVMNFRATRSTAMIMVSRLRAR